MKPIPESQGTLEGFLHRGLAAQRAVDGMLTKLLSRRQDPPTSKQAARVVAVKLTERQEQALACLFAYGRGTTHELAARATRVDGDHYRATSIHHELARRLPELSSKGKAEVTGEVRDGCRVWRGVKQE